MQTALVTAYSRTQADGLDNIAPTALQGQQAWQFASTDNFFSPEEQTAVLRQQLAPYHAQLEAKLTQLGYPPENLAKYPAIADALFSGQATGVMTVQLTPNVQLEGRLRIVMTDAGPDIRITPVERQLTIPDDVAGVRLSSAEQKQLREEGVLSRPLLLANGGEYAPTYLRVDPLTNTVELWRLRTEQLPTKLMGIDLTKDQQLQLVGGHAVRLTGLRDEQGEPFNATVSLSPARQTLAITDVDRLAIGLKPDGEFRQQLAHNNEGAKTDQVRSREAASGSPVLSHGRAEEIKQVLEQEPAATERSLKPNR